MARLAKAALAVETLEGTIRSMHLDKRFGFITAAGTDYFFHASAAPDFDHLVVGDVVTFTPSQGPKGWRADGVSATV